MGIPAGFAIKVFLQSNSFALCHFDTSVFPKNNKLWEKEEKIRICNKILI